MHRMAQQQVHSSKDTLISRGGEDEHSVMQQSSPSAPATQQTAVRTEQDTSRTTITSREVSDGRQRDIIKEPARLEVTGSRQKFLAIRLVSTVKATSSAKNVSGNVRHASFLDCCFWFLSRDFVVMICSELISPSAA